MNPVLLIIVSLSNLLRDGKFLRSRKLAKADAPDDSMLAPGNLPRGSFGPSWQMYLGFSMISLLGLGIAGTGVWGLTSKYPGPVYSLAPMLIGLLVVFVFWTLLRRITVTDDFVEVSGPGGWPNRRIPMADMKSFRIMGPDSPSPALELRFKGGAMTFSLDAEFVRHMRRPHHR